MFNKSSIVHSEAGFPVNMLKLSTSSL